MRVLVVEDDRAVRYALEAVLADADIEVVTAEHGAQALQRLGEHSDIGLVLTDLRMPVMDGMQLLEKLAALPGAPRAVVLTAHGSERVAVQALKAGALDYLTKPFDPDEVVHVVRRSLLNAGLAAENRRLRARLALGTDVIYVSAAMQRVAAKVAKVADKDVAVLITGESGTGKELVARALVAGSRRASRPYVRANCAAIARDVIESELFGHTRGAFTGAVQARKGLFRQAHGGTMLLDEVGDLAMPAQAKLLRVLQEGTVRPVGSDVEVPVDVRIIASTHRDLDDPDVLRPDLLYRLRVVEIRVPPLRDRREDIEPLARHFAERYRRQFGLERVDMPERLLRHLQGLPWPGNVRELEHTVQRMVALSDDGQLSLDDRPATESPTTLKEQVEAHERAILSRTLAACEGNQSETARRLGVSRTALLAKLAKYGLR